MSVSSINPDFVSFGIPFILGAVGTVAAQTLYQKFKPAPTIPADQIIREIFEKNHIKEWHLPGISTCAATLSNPVAPQPKFCKETIKNIEFIKTQIKKSHENCGESPLPNLIIKGEPGVGKTMLMEALCLQSEIGYIRLPSGAMETHLTTGSHIKALQQIFEIAQKCLQPVYIIMDDGEQLVATRPIKAKVISDNITAPWITDKEKMSETVQQRRIALVNAILEESGKDVRKIGFTITTNRPEVIDQAFKTRATVLTINLPEEQERKQIIITHLPTIFNQDERILTFFDLRILDLMAKKTEGFTGRTIVKMLENLYACVEIQNGDLTEDLIDATIVGIKVNNKPKAFVQTETSLVLPAPVKKVEVIPAEKSILVNGLRKIQGFFA